MAEAGFVQSPDLNRTSTDASGATTAGSSKDALAANRYRKWLFIQNRSASDQFWNFGTDAADAAGSIKLAAGEALTFNGAEGFCPTEKVTVFAAGVGNYTVKWWG